MLLQFTYTEFCCCFQATTTTTAAGRGRQKGKGATQGSEETAKGMSTFDGG